VHESPPVMTAPLVVLAILSLAGGWVGLPPVLSEHHAFGAFLAPRLTFPADFASGEASHLFEYTMMGVSVAVLIVVWSAARGRFVSRAVVPPAREEDFGSTTRLLYRKYYVDEFYDAVIARPLAAAGSFFYSVVDRRLIDGFVNATGPAARSAAAVLRKLQTGNTGFYIFAMVVSIVVILLVNLLLIH